MMNLKFIKLAIVGSRTFNDYDLLEKSILENYDIHIFDEISEIVSGGTIGADFLAEKFGAKFKIVTKIFLPNYDKFRKSAPLVRNKQIIDYCDEVIAFWDQKSRGTLYTINLAKQQNKPTIIVNF